LPGSFVYAPGYPGAWRIYTFVFMEIFGYLWVEIEMKAKTAVASFAESREAALKGALRQGNPEFSSARNA